MTPLVILLLAIIVLLAGINLWLRWLLEENARETWHLIHASEKLLRYRPRYLEVSDVVEDKAVASADRAGLIVRVKIVEDK